MKMLLLFSLLSLPLVTFANDSGIAGIEVEQIKMREVAFKNGEEIIVKKIINPSYSIVIEGGEAEKLQQILPSRHDALPPDLTSNDVELYRESFKDLGIFSEKSDKASAKAISISCSSADYDGKKVTKTNKTVCKITIQGAPNGNAWELLENVGPFNPKTCN